MKDKPAKSVAELVEGECHKGRCLGLTGEGKVVEYLGVASKLPSAPRAVLHTQCMET